jgi:hypothetical protein
VSRGGPLVRRTPLRSVSSLRRATPLQGAPLVRRTPLSPVSAKRAAASGKPARPRDTGPDRTTRDLVKLRDDWHCAKCGRVIFETSEWSIHHRRNRGSGGTSRPELNRPSNLLLVCGSATTLCHGELTQNRDRHAFLTAGWVVSLNSRQDPAEVPVLHAVHGVVLLDDDGGIELLRGAA